MRAGTAISARHIILANHYCLWPGVRIVFVGEDGGVCPCSIIKTMRVANTDIMIGLLDYELTPNIKPAKVMSSDWAMHIGSTTNFPIVTFNRHENLLYSELAISLQNGKPPSIRNHSPEKEQISIKGITGEIAVPENAIQRKGMIRVGDSGNPAFMIYNGEPILMYCLLSGGVGSGHYVHKHLNEIQAIMDDLCPGYKLNTVNFSKK